MSLFAGKHTNGFAGPPSNLLQVGSSFFLTAPSGNGQALPAFYLTASFPNICRRPRRPHQWLKLSKLQSLLFHWCSWWNNCLIRLWSCLSYFSSPFLQLPSSQTLPRNRSSELKSQKGNFLTYILSVQKRATSPTVI
jgi:hypothetical protein